MHAAVPASLDSKTLARRLSELAGDERNVQVDFLLHLAEFDARRAYVDAGYPSLWAWCLAVLHLREGAAARRIAAMKVLREFPRVEAPLRDGRLCPSTAALLHPLFTEENLDDLVARAAFKTKAEVDHLVATVRPRSAPQDGMRRLPQPNAAPRDAAEPVPLLPGARPFATDGRNAAGAAHPPPLAPSSLPLVRSGGEGQGGAEPRDAVLDRATVAAAPRSAPELRAVSADQWSLRVTMDAGMKQDLETLKNLLGHKVPTGDLAAVLREAIRCGIETHGKRRGAVRPARTRKPAAATSDDPRSIPVEVRRKVWERDGGQCTFVAGDGTRCGSRFRLELDHVVPVALGGKPTVDGLRLRCRPHNFREAERAFGERYMARYRRETRTGEFTAAGGSAQIVKRSGVGT